MKPVLYPPLSLIEEDLFQPYADPPAVVGGIDGAVPQPGVENLPAMPSYLQVLMARQVASQQANPPQPLAVGQIRRLTCIPTADGGIRPLGRSCSVLLGASLGRGRWHGWLVAQEADYASERDLVLQDDDGCIAPEAAMVQAWNTIEIILTGEEALLGQLPMERLVAVMQLAAHEPSGDDFVAPRPGRIGTWIMNDELTVVTGTPLGDAADPRHGYRRLYGQLAQALNAAATQTLQPKPEARAASGMLAWLRHVFVTPGWAAAALVVILFQGIWMSGAIDFPGAETVYRSAGHGQGTGACAIRLRVVFQPEAAYADVMIVLRRAGAMLVDGPSETGEVWIFPPKDQGAAEAAAMLRQSHIVEQVDVISPNPSACRN